MSTVRPRSRRLFTLLGVALLASIAISCKSDTEKLEGFMQRGDEYREAGRHAEAIIEYRNALQVDPNFAGAHEGLAHSLMKTDQIRDAYWELGETIRLNPANVDARLSYGALSLAAKLNDEALAQAEAVIAVDPENAAGHLLLGQTYAVQERFEEAEGPMLRATELKPDDGSYRAVVANFFMGQKRTADAETQLREGLARDPSPTLWWMLGQLLLGAERFDEAEAALKSGLAAAGEMAAAAGETEPEPAELVQSYQNLAAFYFQRDRRDEAVATLREGIEKSRKRGDLVKLLSRYYRSTGDREAADELMVSATEADPTDPMPFLAVSNLRGQEGDLEGALEYAEKAIAADPTFVPARLRKAEILIDVGSRNNQPPKVAEGRALVDQVLAEDATSPEAHFVLAKVEIASGNVDAGIEAVRTCLDVRPDWGQAHFILGSGLLLKGETQRARAELARAIELEPGLLEARRALAEVHSQLGEHEYAIEHGQRFLEARPDDDRTRILVADSMKRLEKVDDAVALLEVIPPERRSVEVLYALGQLQMIRKNFAGARAALSTANEQRPHNQKIIAALIPLDYEEGKLGHSIKRVNDAVAAQPEESELWHLKGRLAMMTKPPDPVGAETALAKAIELDSNNLGAYQTLAQLYAATGRMPETIGIYEKAVEKQPENAAAHHFLGVLYEATGQGSKAREQYELALKYDPGLGESKNNLAYLMAESGQDLDRALKLAQEAKAAMPISPNAADTLGWVLYKRGVASAAVGYLREALQLAEVNDPSIGEIRNHLSQAYEATGEVDKAIEALELALDDLERLRQGGYVKQDPPWATTVRASIDRLKKSS